MKMLFTSIFLVCACLITNAQTKKIHIEIPRADYNEIEIISDNQKYTLTAAQNKLAFKGERYELDRGKGGQKDVNGHKERNKLYFINAENDTLATILRKEDQISIGQTILNRTKNENGWDYISKEGIIYAWVQLFWNKNKWKYSVEFPRYDKQTKVLEKVLLLTLVDFAIEESKCDDEDSFESLPHILFILSLLAN